MSTTPGQITAIQSLTNKANQLAVALVAGQVTAADQSSLSSVLTMTDSAVTALVPDVGPPPSGLPVPPGYTVLWDDQFLGNTLSNHWLAQLAPGGNRWYNPPGGGVPSPYSGNDLPGYDVALRNPSQVKVGPVGTYPGGVTLTAQRYSGNYSGQGFQWLTGTLSSFPSLLPTTGTGWFVQARIKFCDTSKGIWPAFWLLPQDASQEFDICGTGFTKGTINVNVMGTSDLFSGGQQQSTWDTVPTNTDITAGFHVYGCECIFGKSMTVYFDGQQVYQALASASHPIVPKPYSILLDTQVMIPVGQSPKYNPKGWHAASSAATPSPSWEVAEVQVCVPS